MRILILAILLASASIANATSAQRIDTLNKRDMILVLNDNGTVDLQIFGKAKPEQIVLVRSECIELEGNPFKIKTVTCLVKEKLGDLLNSREGREKVILVN